MYKWDERGGSVRLYSVDEDGNTSARDTVVHTHHWSFLMSPTSLSKEDAVKTKRMLEMIKRKLVEHLQSQNKISLMHKLGVRVVRDGHRLYPSVDGIGVAGFALFVTFSRASVSIGLLRELLGDWLLKSAGWMPGLRWWHVCPKGATTHHLATNCLLGPKSVGGVEPPPLRIAFVVASATAYALAMVCHSARTLRQKAGECCVEPLWVVYGTTLVAEDKGAGCRWYDSADSMWDALRTGVAAAHFVVHGPDSVSSWFRPMPSQHSFTLAQLYDSVYGGTNEITGLHSHHRASREPPVTYTASYARGTKASIWLGGLVYHELGVWPTMVMPSPACGGGGVLHVLSATVGLERARGLVATMLWRQSATAVPLGAPGGRLAYFYSSMAALARERGFVFSTSPTSAPPGHSCTGGVYFMHQPPSAYSAYTGVIELDFKSHYPSSCIACNISAETRCSEDQPLSHKIQDACKGGGALGEPFRVWDTGHHYKADALGILPEMLRRLMEGRAKSCALAAEAAAAGEFGLVASANAAAAWQKLECCSALGIVGSRTELRDQETANDVYSAARAFLAEAVNHTAAHFATCTRCECTHWFSGDVIDKGPAGEGCDAPARGAALLLMGVVTDSLRLQLSPGDSYGDHGPKTGRWIATTLQTNCFAKHPPVSLELAGCFTVYFANKDRSAFGIPMEGTTEPHRWLCKGRMFNSAKAAIAEVSATRASFAIAASLIMQTDPDLLRVATSMLQTSWQSMTSQQQEESRDHIMRWLPHNETRQLLASMFNQ